MCVGTGVGDGSAVGFAVGDEITVELLWVAATVATSGVGVVEGVSVRVCGSSGVQPAKMSKIQEKKNIRFI